MISDHLLLLVAAVAGVQPLVTGGAGEAALVPSLEQRLKPKIIYSKKFFLYLFSTFSCSAK